MSKPIKFHPNGIYIVPDDLVTVARNAAGYSSGANDHKHAAVVVAIIKWLRDNPIEPLCMVGSEQTLAQVEPRQQERQAPEG